MLQSRDKDYAECWEVGRFSLTGGGKGEFSGCDENREQRHRNGDTWKQCL